MRSALCASAPSHPLHVMLSRITRNSHRPRASDRTIVASENHRLACRSLKLDGIVTIGRETHENGKTRPNFSTEVNLSGLDLEKGGAFFLTVL
jgi:hypothetical protein